MKHKISPKYLMGLIERMENSLWDQFEKSKYKNVEHYIRKWHEVDDYGDWENFSIIKKEDNIDLAATMHSMEGDLLLKIAIDLGIETPDFLPSIPTFRNEIKSSYSTASATFEKAFKEIEEHPDVAIGLVNSALESIVKEILGHEAMSKTVDIKNKTLYDLTGQILKEFYLFPNADMPKEIKIIGSSLLATNKGIEQLRSEKTVLHGKTGQDYIVNDPLYTYFIVNSVTTVGLFLMSFYKKKFPEIVNSEPDTPMSKIDIDPDEIPF